MEQVERRQQLLTVRQVAERIGASYWHVRELIQRRELPAVDVGSGRERKSWRVHPDDLRSWLRERGR